MVRCFLIFLFIGGGYSFGATGAYTEQKDAYIKLSNENYRKATLHLSEGLNRVAKKDPTLQQLSASCNGVPLFSSDFDEYVQKSLPRTDLGTNVI
jgi:hypothetical protein